MRSELDREFATLKEQEALLEKNPGHASAILIAYQAEINILNLLDEIAMTADDEKFERRVFSTREHLKLQKNNYPAIYYAGFGKTLLGVAQTLRKLAEQAERLVGDAPAKSEAVGGMKLRNMSWHPGNVEVFKNDVQAAARVISAKGYRDILTGDIFCVKEDQMPVRTGPHSMAAYRGKYDDIVVSIRVFDSDPVQTLIHELAHRLYRKKLARQQIDRWEEIYGDTKTYPTAYAKKSASEFFAECFALWCLGKLPRQYVAYLNEIGIGDMSKALAQRVAARYLQAKRQIMYHGTSTAYLRRILKVGLVPEPAEKQFPDVRPYFGNYPGVYFLRGVQEAMHYAGGTAQKRGGDPMIVQAQIETRTPGVTLDEEFLIQRIEFACVAATRMSVKTVDMDKRVHLSRSDLRRIALIYKEVSKDEIEPGANVEDFVGQMKEYLPKIVQRWGASTMRDWYYILGNDREVVVKFDDAYTFPAKQLVYNLTQEVISGIIEKVEEHLSEQEVMWFQNAYDDLDKAIEHFLIYRDLGFMAETEEGITAVYLGRDMEDVKRERLQMFRERIKKVAQKLKSLTDKPFGSDIGVVIHEPVAYRGSNRIVKITSYPLKGRKKGKPVVLFDRS